MSMLNMAGVLGLSFLGWLWWWRAVSWLAFVVASHAVLPFPG